MNKKNILFWILSLTWGLPMTFIGACIAFVLILKKKEAKRFHQFVYFEVGENWGGVNFGAFFFVSKGADIDTIKHEAGHGIQNTYFGFLQPIIGLCSAARYWNRRYLRKYNPEKYQKLSDYDSAWFEKMATDLGNKYF